MRSLAVIPLIVLSACGPPSEELIAQDANVSPSYRQGFDDGCHSGRQAAGSLFDLFRKDLNRFNSDRDYAQGWSDAYRVCESKEEALERQVRSAQTIRAIRQSDPPKFDNVLRGVDLSALEAQN